MPNITAALATLTERFGFRVSNIDARRAGVPEHVLFDAASRGLARIERVHVVGPVHLVTTYIIFA